MKTKNNYLLVFFLFALLSFTTCQDEVTEIDNPDQQETIDVNSTLAQLITNTSSNYGAYDDILDSSSCFSIELPVTIIVSDITIVIENEQDLADLENLFDDLNDSADFLDFVFPITIIFSDYTELIIENEDQLASYIYNCNDDNDSIDCVDFVYPISFSVFNSEFSLVDTIIIENDEALYDFFESLEDDENALIVSLNYPVTLEYADGETLEVNTNEELSEAIASAENACNDNSDENCEEEEIALNIVECPWEVYLYTNDDVENIDGPYTFTFSEDGILVIDGITDEPHTTTWELFETDAGIELNIDSFYYYEQDYGNWLVVQCDNDELKFEHLTVDGTGLFFEQDCEDDLECSITDISSILQECPWDFSDGTDAYDNYQMVFNANGELLIPEGFAASAIGGYWSLSATNEGIILNFSELTAFQDPLGGDWLIIACDENRIELLKDNQVLVLEQNCLSNNQDLLECYSLYVLLQECDDDNDGIGTFIFETNIPQTQECLDLYPLVGSTHTTYEDAVNNINPISLGVTDPFELTSQTLYIRVYSETTNEYAIQELSIEVESCNDNAFNCFYDFELLECANAAGEAEFNLSADTIGLIDCPESFIPSFHTSIADAEANIGAISNTESYLSISGQVYLRIETASGNFAIFTIYLNTDNCNLFDCFQSFDAVIELCDENNDGIELFDLTSAFANCIPEADVVSYYETESDAYNNVNPIANPQSYTNSVANQQIIYVRVEIDNQIEVVIIQLILEDCSNETSCSETDVDSFLTECIWNAVNYNGSDNLMDWNFDFEANNQIVVIYTDTQTIDATWSTSQTSIGVVVSFSNVAGPNIQSITGEWLVVECETNRLEMHRGDDILVLERNCE